MGRYTTINAAPGLDEGNPLAIVAKVHLPRSVVTTVGDAVRYVLIRTGYQLAADDTLDARVRTVLDLRLPDNQRQLGPYRVDAMLRVLLGAPYQLQIDPVTRTVNYSLDQPSVTRPADPPAEAPQSQRAAPVARTALN